jgi:hypothetical protein
MMATYKYTGDVALELPSLVLTVNPGDTFEAPDGLVADKIAPVTKVTPAKSSASPDTTQGA